MNVAEGILEAWMPRCLLEPLSGATIPSAGSDGLSAVRLQWSDGRLRAPVPLCHPSSTLPLVLPRLADPHVHLDKAFTWAEHPNPAGTYGGAMAANLVEHTTRTRELVLKRGEHALQLACGHGLRALRSHIDSLGPGAEGSWQALLELRERWRGRIALQLVALVPIEHWSTSAGQTLAREVAAAGGLLGGVLVPPFQRFRVREALRSQLRLAQELGCGIDLHIDECDSHPAAGLKQLLAVVEQEKASVPITCSHLSSLGLAPRCVRQRLCERMARHHIKVVALPLTNAWLLGRQPGDTPVTRPLAPIRRLQRAGVCVAVGADNVADPWFPAGSFDPLALMASSLPLAQLAPWQRLGLMPFTTAAAALMDLDWDGVVAEGAPADLIVLDVSSWSEALMRPPERRILIGGRWWPSTTR